MSKKYNVFRRFELEVSFDVVADNFADAEAKARKRNIGGGLVKFLPGVEHADNEEVTLGIFETRAE